MKDVAVGQFPNEMDARMAAQRLEAAGIRTVLVPLGYGPAVLGTAAMLPHELRVLESEVDRAREVLQDEPAGRRSHRRRARKRTTPE